MASITKKPAAGRTARGLRKAVQMGISNSPKNNRSAPIHQGFARLAIVDAHLVVQTFASIEAARSFLIGEAR